MQPYYVIFPCFYLGSQAGFDATTVLVLYTNNEMLQISSPLPSKETSAYLWFQTLPVPWRVGVGYFDSFDLEEEEALRFELKACLEDGDGGIEAVDVENL